MDAYEQAEDLATNRRRVPGRLRVARRSTSISRGPTAGRRARRTRWRCDHYRGKGLALASPGRAPDLGGAGGLVGAGGGGAVAQGGCRAGLVDTRADPGPVDAK